MLRQIVRRIIRFYKTQAIIFVFLALIFIGAVLLDLPIAVRDGKSVGFLDALFTATSATCVTGLTVVDTYQHWSLFGQIVILLLIQTGGLGFMTMATIFSLVLKRTISLSERLFISETLNYDNMHGIVRLVKHIIIGSFAIEAIGAALLSIRFIPEFGVANGIYKAIFHAVSAFCNAGFDLMGQKAPFSSLVSYVSDPLVVFTVTSLVVIGGIGFFVWEDLIGGVRRLKLHTKIVLWTTFILIVSGTALFYLFDGSNPETMLELGSFDKFMASYFQSVTTRTAGFNTIPQDGMTSSSKLLSMILMFIGGSPGSTAGGIKTVTFGVLVLTALAVARGTSNVNAFGKRLSHSVIFRSLTIIMLAIFSVMTATVILSLTEHAPLSVVAYEAVSAFGTAGLSLGITPYLTNAGKNTIIILMFFGRVGVLTIALGLMKSMNSGAKDSIKYPEEKIMVG